LAIVALVEGLVADRLQVGLADGPQDVVVCRLRADERGGESDVEAEAAFLQLAACFPGLLVPLLRKADIAPAGEQVFQVPFALAVADEDECAGHQAVSSLVFGSSVEPENIEHGIQSWLLFACPERCLDGATREDRPVLGLMRERDALAGAGKDHRMVTHHRAAAQRGEADRAFLAWAGMPVAHAHGMPAEVDAAP